MRDASHVILHALVNHSSETQSALLFKHLSSEEALLIHSLPLKCFKDPIKELQNSDFPLESIDVSWIAPQLRSFSEQEIRLFTASLEEPEQGNLKKNLSLSNHLPELTPHARRFLRKTLFSMLRPKEKELLPLACLPDSPLNILLEIKSSTLSLLTQLLGMHDVAVELKQVIDTSLLKRLLGVFSEKQRAYLKVLSHKKESLVFKRLHLSTWNGNEEVLRSIVRHRGLNRLGKALYGEDESLLWYISRRLDIPAGEEMLKLAKPLEHPDAILALRRQVESVIHYLTPLPRT